MDSLQEPDQLSPTTTAGGAGASSSAAYAIQPPGSLGVTTVGPMHDSLRFLAAGLTESTAVGLAARFAAESAATQPAPTEPAPTEFARPTESAPADRDSDTGSPDSLEEYLRNMP